MRWTRFAACKKHEKCLNIFLVVIYKLRRIFGESVCGWEDNIKIDFREIWIRKHELLKMSKNFPIGSVSVTKTVNRGVKTCIFFGLQDGLLEGKDTETLHRTHCCT